MVLHWSKPVERTTRRVKGNERTLWTGSGFDTPVGSSVVTNAPSSLVGLLIPGEAAPWWGQRAVGDLCTFPHTSAVNLKLLKKTLILNSQKL